MAQFTITSAVSKDGKVLASNVGTLDVQAFMEYTRELTTSYSELVTYGNNPTPYPQVFLENIGSDTALIRWTNDGVNYGFTGLPVGSTIRCPLKTDSLFLQTFSARGESGDTTIRVIALYF